MSIETLFGIDLSDRGTKEPAPTSKVIMDRSIWVPTAESNYKERPLRGSDYSPPKPSMEQVDKSKLASFEPILDKKPTTKGTSGGNLTTKEILDRTIWIPTSRSDYGRSFGSHLGNSMFKPKLRGELS